MTFDALTIFGIVYGSLSGGFVLATALAEAPRRSVKWRTASVHFARGRRTMAQAALLGRRGRPRLAWQAS